jgi:hypothetical protein
MTRHCNKKKTKKEEKQQINNKIRSIREATNLHDVTTASYHYGVIIEQFRLKFAPGIHATQVLTRSVMTWRKCDVTVWRKCIRGSLCENGSGSFKIFLLISGGSRKISLMNSGGSSKIFLVIRGGSSKIFLLISGGS